MSITTSAARRAGLGIVAVAALVGSAVPMTSAHAAGRDGVCNSGEFCYYYNSNQAGAVSDFTTSVSNYGSSQPGCYDFKGPGRLAGKGLCVKNHAASVWNRSSHSVTVYFNSGYSGTWQVIPAGAKANLKTGLKNNNASHRFYIPQACRPGVPCID